MDWLSVFRDLGIAFIGALAGAYGGAVAAQRVIESEKRREDLVREIRNTNAAIVLGHAICNSFLALKKQHVKRLHETLVAHRKAFDEIAAERANGKRDRVFEVVADLESLPRLDLPVEQLRAVVYEKISMEGRGLSLVVTVSQSARTVNESIQRRNHLIDEFKVKFAENRNGLIPYYLGLPQNGDVNREYPATLEAIASGVDDGIFFSHLLCGDLMEHGKDLAKRFTEKFEAAAPRVATVDFSRAISQGLMPSEANYEDWKSGFVKAPE